jgi:hypothetical protein
MSELALQQSQANKSQVVRAAEHESEKIHSRNSVYSQDPIVIHQQAYGNHAVQRMLQAKLLQAKLVVNPPDDEYEKEADQMADAVMRMPEPAVQRPSDDIEKDDEEKRRIQTKPLCCQDVPEVQREVEKEDEEEGIQTKILPGYNGSLIHRAEAEKEDEDQKLLQTKLIPGQSTPVIQREMVGEPEDEAESVLQTKTFSDQIALIQRGMDAGTEEEQKRKAEEEKPLQTKPIARQTFHIQRETENKNCNKCPKDEENGIIQSKTISNKAGAIVEDSFIQNLGQGQPLDPSTSAFFEARLGHDFSHVRVHTGAQAEETARSFSAKAYTVGGNIAFGAGRYAPESQEGRWLLAHELTHVIQQIDPQVKNDSHKLRSHESVRTAQNSELRNKMTHMGATASQVRCQPLPDSVRPFKEISRIDFLHVVQRQVANDYYTEEDATRDAIELNGLSMTDMLIKLANMTAYKLDGIKIMADTKMANWPPRVQYAVDAIKNRGHSPEDYIINKKDDFRKIEWDAWEAIYRFLGGQPKNPGDQIEVNSKKGVMYKQEIRIGGPKTWMTNDPGALTTGILPTGEKGALERLKGEGANVGAYTDEGGKFKVSAGTGRQGDPKFGSFPVSNTSKSAQEAFDTCEGEGFKALKAWIRGVVSIHDIARKQLGGQAKEGNLASDKCGSSSEETVSRYTNCLIDKFRQLDCTVQGNSKVPPTDDFCLAAKAVAMVEGWTSFIDRTSTLQAKQPGLIVRPGYIYLERVVKPVGGSLAKFVIEENQLPKPPTFVKGYENKFECWLLLVGLRKDAK